jgi:hypothetical protein
MDIVETAVEALEDISDALKNGKVQKAQRIAYETLVEIKREITLFGKTGGRRWHFLKLQTS